MTGPNPLERRRTCRRALRTMPLLVIARRPPSSGGADRWTGFAGRVLTSDACFAALLGDPEHGRWLLAPSDPAARVYRAALSRRYIDPRDAVRDNRRCRPAHRLHAAAQRALQPRPHRRRETRSRSNAYGIGRPLRLRRHGALGSSPGGRHAAGDRGTRSSRATYAGTHVTGRTSPPSASSSSPRVK